MSLSDPCLYGAGVHACQSLLGPGVAHACSAGNTSETASLPVKRDPTICEDTAESQRVHWQAARFYWFRLVYLNYGLSVFSLSYILYNVCQGYHTLCRDIMPAVDVFMSFWGIRAAFCNFQTHLQLLLKRFYRLHDIKKLLHTYGVLLIPNNTSKEGGRKEGRNKRKQEKKKKTFAKIRRTKNYSLAVNWSLNTVHNA